MGEVSAEEVAPGGEEDADAQALSAGAPASEELARVAFAALAHLAGGSRPDPAAARRVGERIAADHGYLPVAVGRALCYAATALGGRRPRGHPPQAAPKAVAREEPQPAPTRVEAASARELAYWQGKGC